jgi:hypothetical protein
MQYSFGLLKMVIARLGPTLNITPSVGCHMLWAS